MSEGKNLINARNGERMAQPLVKMDETSILKAGASWLKITVQLVKS